MTGCRIFQDSCTIIVPPHYMRRYDDVEVGLVAVGVLGFEQFAQRRNISQAADLVVVGNLAFLGQAGFLDDSIYSRVPAEDLENPELGLTVGRADVSVWVKNISNEITFYPVFPAATGAGG